MPAILAILGALAPLVPLLSEQIMNLVNLVKQDGALTPEQQQAAHALHVKVHEEVQRIVAERAAQG